MRPGHVVLRLIENLYEGSATSPVDSGHSLWCRSPSGLFTAPLLFNPVMESLTRHVLRSAISLLRSLARVSLGSDPGGHHRKSRPPLCLRACLPPDKITCFAHLPGPAERRGCATLGPAIKLGCKREAGLKPLTACLCVAGRAPFFLGGAGLLLLSDLADLSAVAYAFRLLTSPDPKIAYTSLEELAVFAGLRPRRGLTWRS
ncbi:hypothetical protein J6590_051721 [Homalodisca vitripennis]|nr:hypothetical protein J6590_051721 [Homalodisca vitripennis]